jgi:predicted Zn finger-like uncharacterized protein
MIIVCQQCTSRFRIDDAKTPSGGFTVSCPKCQATLTAGAAPAVRESGALAPGRSPATAPPRFEKSMPAPQFSLSSKSGETEAPEAASSAGLDKLATILISLLKSESNDRTTLSRPSWDRRRALVCVAEKRREQVAGNLAQNGYEVFVAQDTQQAVERMRESRLDVVIMEPDFDPIEQGAAFVTREVNVLRPAQRRRLFFVYLSSSKRTMDMHAAFLQNANAVVHFNDAGEIAEILDRSLREFNELYKDFNAALGVPAL